MKRLFHTILVLAALLLTAPQQALAQASDVLNMKANYTTLPNSNGVFTVKVPVYVGGRGGNRWADEGSTITVTTEDGNEYTLVEFMADNWDNDESGTHAIKVKVNPKNVDLGVVTFKLPNGDIKESTYNNNWMDVTSAMTKDITGEHNTVYLELTWKGSYNTFHDKSLNFKCHAWYNARLYSPLEIKHDMGTYVYKSTLTPPSIAGVYLNINALKGQEGQMTLIGYSVAVPTQLMLVVNDEVYASTQNCVDGNFEFVLERSDITRIAKLRAVYNDEGTATMLESKPYTIYPYHSIQDLTVTEPHVEAPGISTGHKEITWKLDASTVNDLYSNDKFIVERAYYNDMSDAVQIASVSYSDTTSRGQYIYVDKSPEAVTNPYRPADGKGYYSSTYYRVRRASASALLGDNIEHYSDTRYAHNMVEKLPKVTSIKTTFDENYKNNRRMTAHIILDMAKYRITDNNMKYYAARWNEDAQIKLALLRYDDFQKILFEADTLTLDSKEVVYDSEKGCYQIDKSIVLNEAGVTWYLKAWVEVPSTASHLRFADGSTEDEGFKFGGWNYSEVAFANNVTATQGTEHGFVRVQWELPTVNVNKVRVLRRVLGYSGAHYIAELEPGICYYEDHEADLGVKYEYGIQTVIDYRGEEQSVTRTSWDKAGAEAVIGWIAETGKISGRVVTTQNTGIGGQLMRIYDSEQKAVMSVTTSANGTFIFDNLPLKNEGVQYTVQPDNEHLQFTYNGEKTGATVTLTPQSSLAEGYKFVCTSVERFSGRVLFENSTVPVSGAAFRINGEPVYAPNGELLTTDQDGNFELEVPRHQVTVQVYKPGHRFVNNGFVVDKEEGTNEFTPTSAYDGLTLYDQTRVLLRGRVVGGNTLAALPLGQGLGQNNLGNSITLQMKLEGNNTASIVYLKDEPERDTLVVYNEQQWKGKTVTRTRTDFYRKYFNIHVDNDNGEYAVEVFPTKYKITQAYAQGYASLFANGEVSQIIDLTDSVAVDSTQLGQGSYCLTYHSDVDITYKQLYWGTHELPYLGAKEVESQNLAGKTYTTPLVTVEDDKCNYLMGAPVFLTGETYFLQGHAHEDYYFNNVKTGIHYIEPLRQGQVTVTNGLVNNGPKTETYELDEEGKFQFKFVAGNDNFSLTGNDALRQLNSNVTVNGYYYHGQPIEAYVTGQRDKEGSLYTYKNAYTKLLDILRDPPGPNGSAYYGAGRTWSMNRTINFSASASMDIELKKGTNYTAVVGSFTGTTEGGGAFTGSVTTGSTDFAVTLPIPLVDFSYTRNVNYSFTTKERISTSSNPLDVGAMADVYIGTTMDYVCQTKQVICIIDSVTYTYSKPSIDEGLIHVIQQGQDNDGHPYYLVVAEQIELQTPIPSTFAYSQKHILTKVIPNLMAQRSALLLGGPGVTKKDVENMATVQGKILYYYKGDKPDEIGIVDYEPCFPNGVEPSQYENEVEKYNDQIKTWLGFIRDNEQEKLKAVACDQQVTSYSISAGQNVSVDESISYGEYGYGTSDDNLRIAALGMFGWNMGAGEAENQQLSNLNKLADAVFGNTSNPKELDSQEVNRESFINTLKGLLRSDTRKDVSETDIKTPTSKFTIKITPDIDLSYKDSRSGMPQKTFDTGYSMGVGDDSYINVSVYRCTNKWIKEMDAMKEMAAFVSKDEDTDDVLHEYIFMVNGGATRNPWMDADSTLCYLPGTPLGTRTVKIDNPKMTVVNPVVSNVPEDEKAVFQLKLTNDSELTGNQTLSTPSSFTLILMDGTNPNGAKVSIDGMPLTDGRGFIISPGETVTKTVEVARGTGYDFENLGLLLVAGSDLGNYCVTSLSAHFLPSSSPVSISIPTDKWVMNTFSAQDTLGYYLPVVIEGYDVNYANFDHIELQYKKSTEGENGWANLCSYYADDDLYQAASGTKSKDQILTGRITHPFYGEKDPIEMKYDLRAVSFCRLGTGYVTRTSNVISGIKDTRRPSIFGQAQPINGVLTSGGSIILPFSENIAYNYLDETSNFDVRGYTNSTDIDTNVGLAFAGVSEQDAYTTVSRNLDGRDFTVDMLVRPTTDRTEMTLFSHGNPEEGDIFEFGITDKRQLFANVNGTVYRSRELEDPINQDMTHVGVEFDVLDLDDYSGDAVLRFFVGNSFIDSEDGNDIVCGAYHGNSPIHFGASQLTPGTAPFQGRMLEVRLWNQALDVDMISAYDRTILDGYTNRIIGYWPMRQAEGDAVDQANGADLSLHEVNWHTTTGHSLVLNNKEYQLDGPSFQRGANFDYTLAFWMRLSEAGDNAQIFSAGNDKLAEEGMGKLRIGFQDGMFVVRSNGNTTRICNSASVVDNQWHHFALTVSHSKNLAHIYLDGMLTQQLQGDKMDGITNEQVTLGSDNLQGNIDLITFWRQALPQNYLQHIRSYRLNGDEMGLYVYLPFDEPQESIQGTIANQFTVANLAQDNKDIYKKTMVMGETEVDDKNNAPVLDCIPLSKLKFSWSSDGTNLLINLNMKDSEINHNNVLLTVRDVEDLNGNTMANPYSWVIYTDLNILRWDEDSQVMKIKQGETYEGEATWSNITSTSVNYTISTSSPYIKLSEELGVASPIQTNRLNYTIDRGMTPGEYTEYIWLRDEDNDMTSTLQLHFTVEGEAPNWEVDRNKYDQTMTLIGNVYLCHNGIEIIDTDTRDIVGVFVGNECVGASNLSNSNGLTQLYLNIYGNSTLTHQALSFYLWDHSAGVITRLTPEMDIYFYADAMYGTPPASPIKLTASDNEMQDVVLQTGWNWLAFNVKPDGKTASTVFLDNRVFSNADIIKDDSKHTEYSTSRKTWLLDNVDISHKKVYHVLVHKPTRVNVLGSALTDADCEMQIHTGWNELPYLLNSSMPVRGAMADYQINDKGHEGDILKGIGGFAVLSSAYGWIGSLQTLDPGQGYYLYHTGQGCTFNFKHNDQTAAQKTAKAPRRAAASDNNMMVIAAMAEGEALADDAVILAYAGSECLGEAVPVTLPDGCLRYFITVGQTQQRVHFVVTQPDAEPVIVGSLPYNETTCIGSLKSPYQLSTQGNEPSSDLIYDLLGRRTSQKAHNGVIIQQGHKVLTK